MGWAYACVWETVKLDAPLDPHNRILEEEMMLVLLPYLQS